MNTQLISSHKLQQRPIDFWPKFTLLNFQTNCVKLTNDRVCAFMFQASIDVALRPHKRSRRATTSVAPPAAPSSISSDGESDIGSSSTSAAGALPPTADQQPTCSGRKRQRQSDATPPEQQQQLPQTVPSTGRPTRKAAQEAKKKIQQWAADLTDTEDTPKKVSLHFWLGGKGVVCFHATF